MKALTAAALAACIASSAVAAPATTVGDLDWMTGLWTQKGGEGREAWLPPVGGQMVGLSQSPRPGRRPSYEFERIEARDGVLTFTAIIEGQPPTPFALLSSKDGEVVFQNLEHDFPQRVIYRRCGVDLCARIEGTINGKLEGEDWRYARAIWAR
jgi:hypothetical protein